jgi:ribonuclease BN (tRNA processing enzyme)
VDTEAKRVSPAELGPDLPLYQGVDLMIFDAQYTILESIEKIDWGHSVASIGLDIAFREKIKKMVFMHHDPASSDEKIARAESEAQRYHASCQKEARRLNEPFESVDWLYAQEGMEFEL